MQRRCFSKEFNTNSYLTLQRRFSKQNSISIGVLPASLKVVEKKGLQNITQEELVRTSYKNMNVL